MTRLRDSWIRLAGDVVITVGTGPKRADGTRPRRFLMLGPMPKNQTLRPTLCAGSWDGTSAKLDHGAVSHERLAELERVLRARDGGES